jgi:cytochrome oxidase Cu insertion factor (SCO1/SenC/PrrC family)
MQKNKISILLILIFISLSAQAQDVKSGTLFTKQVIINEDTIIKDTSGQLIPYTIWNSLRLTGEYGLKPVNIKGENVSYVLFKLPESDKKSMEEAKLKMPKPLESKFFRNGQKFFKIKTTDMYGNKINTKNYKGKILVVNYWFTNCGPCVQEIPELNKIVDKYKNDNDIVFISIALDDAYTLETFLKTHTFKYRIIDNGRIFANDNGIKSYPTNVVVDRNNKVFFHTSGLSSNTVLWIDKSIQEIKAKVEETTN